MLQLERELVQARLKEAESQCALKEMQDKILDMEKVGVHEREALATCWHVFTTGPIVLCDNQISNKQQVSWVKSVILFTAAVKQSKGMLELQFPSSHPAHCLLCSGHIYRTSNRTKGQMPQVAK